MLEEKGEDRHNVRVLGQRWNDPPFSQRSPTQPELQLHHPVCLSQRPPFSHSHRCWQSAPKRPAFTGRTHPSSRTCARSISFAAGGSILAQAELLTVCSIKPSWALWEKNRHKHSGVTSSSPVFVDDHFSRQRKLTFCAVGSGPARHACTLPAGRVADAAVATTTGLVTSRPIETSRARCQETEKTISLPPGEL
ncbi:hypothetical protein GOODEAATRI_017749 [Goodea atripinnis]|uniref:Uncharacterized protein n=1 Tax=Goodea atripinnis TaxID=208336 RepID=A0ABV0NVH2_9TELE